MRYLEDFTVGQRLQCQRRITVSKEDILRFAREFDPQPFHLDEEAAKASSMGGLCASGWHMAALCHRILVDEMVALGAAGASLGSPGADQLRWHRPLVPGDELSLTVEVLAVVPSRSKADRGSIQLAYTACNGRGEVLMTMVGRGIFRRRPSL